MAFDTTTVDERPTARVLSASETSHPRTAPALDEQGIDVARARAYLILVDATSKCLDIDSIFLPYFFLGILEKWIRIVRNCTNRTML